MSVFETVNCDSGAIGNSVVKRLSRHQDPESRPRDQEVPGRLLVRFGPSEMDLNKTYPVNIVYQPNKGHSCFIAVERFSNDPSKRCLNYLKKLQRFNQCSEWFSKLDYSMFEVGKIVLAKSHLKNNKWARGVITKMVDGSFGLPELYLIDSQEFSEHNNFSELRICPRKFAQLKLPTYYIDADLNLDNIQQEIIEMLVEQNQYGKIRFSFTPLFKNNNIYYGELIVNYKIEKFSVPLRKVLKNTYKYKCFNDVSKYRQHRLSIFEPLQLKCMKAIFIPKDPNNVLFLEESNSFSDLSDSNNSLESNELLSFSNYSNNSDLELEISEFVNSISPIEKLQFNSFSNSSTTNNNVLVDSVCSEKTCVSPILNSTLKKSTNHINQNIPKKQESTIILRTSSEKSDANELNNLNTAIAIHDIINPNSITKYSKFDSNIPLEVKSDNVVSQENKVDCSKVDLEMRTFFSNRIRCLKKLKNTNHHQINTSDITKEVSETRTTPSPSRTKTPPPSERTTSPSRTKTPPPSTKPKVKYQKYADVVLYWTDEESS